MEKAEVEPWLGSGHFSSDLIQFVPFCESLLLALFIIMINLLDPERSNGSLEENKNKLSR